ncbi:hypothetical protein F53441_1460 [Fusarium austroafricanum]|uniref:EXPERA domain-containing protein n=1 Tax=Fusarium austroafricanum TaxID=2364996 RepID=A0A8H4P269_9HYPO|nr:hypothetical protein F53441_1460 [Fusarium austroafricanum]
MVTTRASSRGASIGPEIISTVEFESIPATPSTSARKRAMKTSNPSVPTNGAATNGNTEKQHLNIDSSQTWRHIPSSITILWLAISLPLVIWDMVYVFGRPHTMPDGFLHWPLYVPYALYGEVDHIYGWKAFNSNNGFTAAQTTLNLVETFMYLVYLWMLWTRADATSQMGTKRSMSGRDGALAVMIGFSAAVMTLSKTVLYWANEYYSGFDNIGHNSPSDLIILWVIPNGAWIVFSAYMTWMFGKDIIDGLTLASGQPIKKRKE